MQPLLKWKSNKYDTGLLDLDAGQLARSQNPEGPATGHLDPGFLGFPGS